MRPSAAKSRKSATYAETIGRKGLPASETGSPSTAALATTGPKTAAKSSAPPISTVTESTHRWCRRLCVLHLR